MHFALFSCSQSKLLQFSSWLRKPIGVCYRLLLPSLCAHPLNQQIKLSMIVQLSWIRSIHMIRLKALIIKSKYAFHCPLFCYLWSMNQFFSHELFFRWIHCCSHSHLLLYICTQVEIIFTKIIIQSESFAFTCGYFAIDMRMMHSFVYTSITYLVILLQFNFE